MLKATIHVTLKNGVLDPQGTAITGALHHMGMADVEGVRQGKYFEVLLKEKDPAKAKEKLEKICSGLLANTVVENYRYEISE